MILNLLLNGIVQLNLAGFHFYTKVSVTIQDHPDSTEAATFFQLVSVLKL